MNTKRNLFALFFLTLATIGLGSRFVAASESEGQFGLQTLRGAWGFSAFGSIGGVPAAAIGRLTFDGAGSCSNVATLNFGGTLVPLATNLTGGACSYTVNADGTGRVEQTFIDPAGQLAVFDVTLVIVDNRKEFRFIVDDPLGTTVGNGVAKRQRGNND